MRFMYVGTMMGYSLNSQTNIKSEYATALKKYKIILLNIIVFNKFSK